MADDEPVSFDDHGDFDEFKAYITTPDVTREQLLPRLVHPEADDDDAVHIEVHVGKTAQELIQHHRDTTPITRNSKIHPRLFIVVDTADLDNRGVLLVALDEYHGFNDAVRGPIDEKRDELMSLSIANDDWYTAKQISDQDKPEAVPKKYFVLYNLISDQDAFYKAFERLNRGLSEVNVQDEENEENMDSDVDSGDEDGEGNDDTNERDEDDEWEDEDEDEDEEMGEEEDEDEDEEGWDHYYIAFKPEVQTLSNVKDTHRNRAIENNQDPSMFAIIDNEYESQGTLIMRVSPEDDSFRCKGDVAGEILRWIFISFMSWDEAKEFVTRLN
ncbi:hypothetical protein FPOA_06520 [Fusarium poae]|uniref:Uncharacterized protein n=1 Tax=Fusarium poae TaxID=36050 RepID=A0A1B8AZS6_FUSPO|nr:hypothetical protein FPOA_06520 [Fusarium poae]